MMKFSNAEREMISVFLTDAYHQKDIRRAMEHMVETKPKENVLGVIERLELNGSLSPEDAAYLKRKIEKLYDTI